MTLKKDNATVFVLSLLFSLFILLIERSLNIGIDYHPDSLTYLNNSHPQLVTSFLQNPLNYVGSFYFVMVGFFNSEAILLILLNIFLFSLTNLILFSKVRDIYSKNGLLFYCSVLIIIFDPYRAHLSVHVLKDTLIIFSLVLILFSSNRSLELFGIFMGSMLRSAFFIYFPILFFNFIKKKNFGFIMIMIVIFSYHIDQVINGLSAGQEVDMAFRSFDIIPNFIDLGYPWGEILRAITWPIIRLTGLAFTFHPIYFLFLFQSIAIMYLIYCSFRHTKIIIFSLLIVFAGLAVVTTGYNSYLRWSQPLMTVVPILLVISSSKIINRKTKYK
jgi:hypothetical protein